MKRVLVVDDDVAVQRHCREILEAEGFEVSCESSLGSARRFLRHNTADTILMDLFLPDGCGYDLFRTSADLLGSVPVVAMTSVYQGSANARLMAVRHPFVSVLPKPVGVASLVEVLRGVFAGAYPKAPEWARREEATVVVPMDSILPPEAMRESERPASMHRSNVLSAISSSPDFVSPFAASAGLGGAVSDDALGWDPTGPDTASSVAIKPLETQPEQAPVRLQTPPVAEPSVDDHTQTAPETPAVMSDATTVAPPPTKPEPIPEPEPEPPPVEPEPTPPPMPPVAPVIMTNGVPRKGRERITTPVQRRRTSAPKITTRSQPIAQIHLERTVQTRYPEDPHSAEHRLNPRNPDSEGLAVPDSLDPRRAPLQGRLGEVPFPVILTRIARTHATGSLLLRREKVKKIVFIDKGVPRGVKSNLLYECLGQVLVRDNTITDAACEASVQIIKAEKRLQGDILVEMGALGPQELQPALTRQFKVKLNDVFTWNEGLYQFRPATSVAGESLVEALDPFEVILDGIREGFPADRIAIELSPFMAQAPALLVARSDLKALGLTESERDWLRLLDNRRTLGNILNITGGAEGVYRMFFALVCLGLMAFRPQDISYAPTL